MRRREMRLAKSSDGQGHLAFSLESEFAVAATTHSRECKLPHPRMPDSAKYED